MATLSTDQIRTLLENAGFSKNSQTLSDMVGIAYAESGGNPNAHNSKPPDDSYGLWQINMIGSLGPDRRKKFGISSNTALFDPATNAKAAYVIYKSQGLDAWTTYKNGEYLKHMDGMTTAEGGNKNPVTSIKDSVSDQFSGLTASINAVGQNVFKIGTNITGVIVAIVLLILGVVILITQTRTGKSALDVGKKVAKL